MAYSPSTKLSDIDLSLRRIIRLLEASAVTDVRQRQIVTIGAVKTSESNSVPTECAATVPVSGVMGTGINYGNTLGQGPPYTTSTATSAQAICEVPVDQRWRVMEDSHISYQMGIRNKLSFS